MSKKVLIIRFSSFGDIVQNMSILRPIKESWPDSELHWVTRSDMCSLLSYNQYVDKVWSFDRKEGMLGLIKLSLELKNQGYTHVYDAHCNIRSKVMSFILSFPLRNFHFTRRYKDRWKRVLLFNFKINKFPWPFRGMESYLKPLEKFGISFSRQKLSQSWDFSQEEISNVEELLSKSSLEKGNFVAIAPSAAWEMKRWPLSYWKELIGELKEEKFVVLGGPTDHFCEELKEVDPARVVNMAGKMSLMESSLITTYSKGLVSADTGVLHVADLLGVKALALIGPTAFGFPTGSQVETMEVNLDCRPCTKDGRGKCIQRTYQKCMVDIEPKEVADMARDKFSK